MTTTPTGAEARPAANPVDVGRLRGSKWTAVQPAGREKHFDVVAVDPDAAGRPLNVHLRAVLTGRVRVLPWRNLRDTSAWRVGWVD